MGACSSMKTSPTHKSLKNGERDNERRRLSLSTISYDFNKSEEHTDTEKNVEAAHLLKPINPELHIATHSENGSEDYEQSTHKLLDYMPKGSTYYLAFGLTETINRQNSACLKRMHVHTNANSDYLHTNGLYYKSIKGMKPESPNQDVLFVMRSDNWGLYGVFDGHGPHGHFVSHFVHQLLPMALLQDPEFKTFPKRAFTRSFTYVHSELVKFARSVDTDLDVRASGTTATVILHQNNFIYTAHVGDSRAIIANRVSEKLTAYELTNDHKPTRPDEQERIESYGGEIRLLEGDVSYRVFLKGLNFPGLAMSRAIGDTMSETVGVTSVPEVNEFEVNPNDEFIVMCSDGVWEFLSNQEVVDIIEEYPSSNFNEGIDKVIEVSWDRWIEEEKITVDDITCLAFKLNRN